MKNAFVIVTLSGALAACAVAPPQQANDAAPVAAAPAPAFEPAAAARVAVDEDLPNVPLTSDMLYKIMKAELEFKTGRWQGPYVTMLGLAQLTRDPRLARRAAEFALASKQAPETLTALRLWRELAPNSEEAARYFLGFVIMSDRVGEAEEVFRQRLEEASPSTRGPVIFQVQQLMTRSKDKDAANEMLERLLAPYKDTLEAHVVLAQTALARGDSTRALAEAQAALAAKPDSELAVLTLAQVMGDDDAVGVTLAQFLVRHPGAREVRGAHARVLANQKQFDKARDEFLLLLKDQPDNPDTLYALGLMSMQLKQNDAAENYFKHYIELATEHPSEERDPTKVLLVLSQIAEEKGDLAAAIQWIERIDSGEPRAYFAGQVKRAELVAKQGDVERALVLLGEVKTDDAHEQAQLLLAQAQILRDAAQTDKAYALLEDGAKRFPGDPDLLYDYALLAEKTGHLDVMEAALRAVIAQAPENHQAYNALGYSLAERNIRLPEALELIGKALKMAPDDPFIMDSMGWVQFRLGNLGEAEGLLRRAYSLRNDPEIAVHLGEVLWQKGQQADARKLWREARAKDPQNDTLKSTLARLNQSL